MKTVSYSKKMKILLIIVLLLVLPSVTNASNETHIIAPGELSGVVGTLIDTSEIFVQKITFSQVENIKDIEIVDDKGIIITKFPKQTVKAYVRRIGSKLNLGFITLKGEEAQGRIGINENLKGEFLFYQNGRVFNKLHLVEEGKLYFYRQPKTLNSPPLILFIGTIEDGEFTYEDYVTITPNTIELRR